MNKKKLIIVFLSLACLCSVSTISFCLAEDASDPGLPILEKLIKSIEINDYNGFIANGTDSFKTNLTRERFTDSVDKLAERFKKGYSCLYLGELKKKDYRHFVWKLTFKDGRDDVLARLIVKDGKVSTIQFFW